MEYKIIKGLEDPVRIKGFLLLHFYALIVVALFGMLIILSSISLCIESGSIVPLVSNIAFVGVMMIGSFIILHFLSNKKKFRKSSACIRTSNIHLFKKLNGKNNEYSIDMETARRLSDIAKSLDK